MLIVKIFTILKEKVGTNSAKGCVLVSQKMKKYYEKIKVSIMTWYDNLIL